MIQLADFAILSIDDIVHEVRTAWGLFKLTFGKSETPPTTILSLQRI